MCAIAQCHEASLRTFAHTHVSTTAPSTTACCVCLCAREKKTRSKFDLLSEMIFKDLAVLAVTIKLANVRKLVCTGCGHILLILGTGGKLCS